jgi:hypothetical protein
LAGVLTVVVVTGCGASHHSRAKGPAGKAPIVIAHPVVRSTGIPSAEFAKLKGNRAMLLPPSWVAFMTTGSVTCAWWPARLTIFGRSEIRIDMRVNGRVSTCGAGAVGFPIAVNVDPRMVDIHRPLTVRLAYKVGTRRWSHTAVAPAISRS